MIAENALRAGDRLDLAPPLPELPPPFWQTPVFWCAAGAGAILVAAAIVSVILIRRKRRAPEPEALAFAALENDGSPAGVTRALRAYLARRIPEAREGLTTGELASISAPAITPEWTVLMLECDDAKFARADTPPDLAARARRLVETAGRHFRETAKR